VPERRPAPDTGQVDARTSMERAKHPVFCPIKPVQNIASSLYTL